MHGSTVPSLKIGMVSVTSLKDVDPVSSWDNDVMSELITGQLSQ